MEMKDENKDKMRKIAEIEKQIWKVYDIFKKEGLGVDDSHLLLLFLSLYKDGQLSEFLDQLDEPNDNQTVGEAATSYSSQNMNYLQVAASEKQFSEFGKHYISEQFAHVDKEDLLENYEGVFESVLHQITISQGRVGGESMQPDELTRFIANLLDLPNGAKVYNPFAGYGSYAFYLDEGCKYFGQELNPKTWTLGKLRMKAHIKFKNTNYVCENSILNWPKESEKFDLIISTPPFGMRLDYQFDRVDGRIRRVEQFLIEKGVCSLNEKGKLIALLPQSILSNGGQDHRLRKELIEKDLIDTIISLPGGLLLNTGIPLVILVIDMDKNIPGKVRFVDADKYVDAKSVGNRMLNDKELNSLIKTSTQDSESVRFVDNKQIEELDYNLSVPRYFIDENIEGVKLCDILETITGERKNIPDSGKFIRIRDLNDDKLDFKLDLSKVEKMSFGRQRVRLIDESCLLLATVWKSTRPTFFEFVDTPIFLSSDILSYRINDKLAVPAYLINELHADYVKKQFSSYKTGGVIPRIREKDLLEVIVKLPSLEAQRAKIQGVAELSDQVKALQREQDIFAYEEASKQFDEFASLKHTLGTPRENISAWTENLIDFLSKKHEEFEFLNQSFKEFYEVDILSALKEIRNDVNFMTEIIENGEESFQLKRYEKSHISLSEINSLIKDISSQNYNFKIKKFLLKGDKLKDRGIDGHRIPLRALLNNIFRNAHKYGFDKKEQGNEVAIELKEVDGFLLLEIRNNGNPFPRNYDRNKFITKYSTTATKDGKGMGGYHINEIASNFENPEWKLILNEDPFYPVKFEFQFPIKTII